MIYVSLADDNDRAWEAAHEKARFGAWLDLRLRRATRRNAKRIEIRKARTRRFFRDLSGVNVGRRK